MNQQQQQPGETLLHYAARTNNIYTLFALLNQGIKPDDGSLRVAVRYNSVLCVDILLEHKANVHSSYMDGYTVLHDACSMGHIDIIKRLLHYKANPFSTTPHNHKTPLDVAQNYSCHSTIALMKQVMTEELCIPLLIWSKKIEHPLYTRDILRSIMKLSSYK